MRNGMLHSMAVAYLGDFPRTWGPCRRCREESEITAAWIVQGEVVTLALCQDCRDAAQIDPGEPKLQPAQVECLRRLTRGDQTQRELRVHHTTLYRCMEDRLVVRRKRESDWRFVYRLTEAGREALADTVQAGA